MKMRILSSIGAAVLAVLLVTTAFAAPEIDGIASWRTVGKRWALGLDENRQAIALYDLSFPKLTGIHLGKIRSKDQATLIEAEIQAAERDYGLNAEETYAVRESLQIWRKGGDDSPDVIRGRDIRIEPTDELPAEAIREALEGLEIIRSADGGYDMYWTPPFETDNDESTSGQGSKPKKLADLRSPKWGFIQAAKEELIQKALSKATDLIPGNFVSALVSTAINRYFHFRKLMVRSQQNMVLEWLNEGWDQKDGVFPKNAISAEEREALVTGLYWAQTSLANSWKWIWKNPLDSWQGAVEDNAEYAELSREWLAEDGVAFNDLGARFAETSGADHKIYLLAAKKPGKDSPLVAVDSADPRSELRRRLQVELTMSTVIFMSHLVPVPYVGSIAKNAYQRLFEKPLDKAKVWEARLIAHLEQSTDGKTEARAADLDQLYTRRLNPLMPSRTRTDALIQERLKYIGLGAP